MTGVQTCALPIYLDVAIDRHPALERAAEGGGDGDLAAPPSVLGQRDDLHRGGERFVRALPLIADAETVARHAHRAEFVDASGRERALGAAGRRAGLEAGERAVELRRRHHFLEAERIAEDGERVMN